MPCKDVPSRIAIKVFVYKQALLEYKAYLRMYRHCNVQQVIKADSISYHFLVYVWGVFAE